jgi:N-hydroxyarylamine O-acetyltransferase
MNIADYLDRIGLKGPLPATSATLEAVHRAQAFAIPYEGLDVQLGVSLDFDQERIFDKLVRRRRGGWCYETNGLLEWALKEIGFDIQRCTAGVYRRERGDTALGNHLTLVAVLDQPWLCDLGLGDGLRAPIPLAEGVHRDGPLEFRLECLADGYWRFHNHHLGTPTTFDFMDRPADEALMQERNNLLQRDPESHFVQNVEAVRMGPDHAVILLGRVLRHVSALGTRKSLIASPEAMAQTLSEQFGISGVDCFALWPQILARHQELFGSEDASS